MRAIARAIARLATNLPSRPHGVCELFENVDCRVPIDAGIRDANTALQPSWTFGWYLLIALVQVRLDHDADDALLALAELIANGLRNLGLVLMVLLRVACRDRD